MQVDLFLPYGALVAIICVSFSLLSGCILHYSIGYRNLSLYLSVMTSLSCMCGISFLKYPLISCSYPLFFLLRAAVLHNCHSMACLHIYSFLIPLFHSQISFLSLKSLYDFSFYFTSCKFKVNTFSMESSYFEDPG